MKNVIRVLLFLATLTSGTISVSAAEQHIFVCPICYHVKDIFDTKTYPHSGKCPICGMNLIERHDIDKNFPVTLHTGSGNFYMEGGVSHTEKLLTVYYHMPKNFTADSQVLLVIPGSGRNAWSYRDSWKTASEKYGVVILSPEYNEQDYDIAAYHLAGIVAGLELHNVTIGKDGERINSYTLKDEDILPGAPTAPETWIFNDFDRIFDRVVSATHSQQKNYDIFGHSAGGQILQRMAIFAPASKAKRIVAANAGSYTLTSLVDKFPFGIANTQFKTEKLKDSFATQLILLLGENDSDKETGGIMLHTPFFDQQGLGRLARGKYFYSSAHSDADNLNTPFNWTLKIVKNVGHDYQRMGEAAADLLYNEKQ